MAERVRELDLEKAQIVSCDYDIYLDQKKIGYRSLPLTLSTFKMHLSNWLPMSMTVIDANLAGAKQMPSIRKRQDYLYWLYIFKQNKVTFRKCGNLRLGAYERRAGSVSSDKMQNLKYNFFVFNSGLRYPFLISAFLVTINVLVRILRR